MPDLQEWVARYGGYPNIPWGKWDQAVADCRLAQCALVQAESDRGAQRHPGKRPTAETLQPARRFARAVPELEANTIPTRRLRRTA